MSIESIIPNSFAAIIGGLIAGGFTYFGVIKAFRLREEAQNKQDEDRIEKLKIMIEKELVCLKGMIPKK